MQAWSQLGSELPKPKAILVVSAHWVENVATVSVSPLPETIHDFYGFPNELYTLNYPCRGDLTLSKRVQQLLNEAHVPVETACHGLDHGASVLVYFFCSEKASFSWVPLKAMYPDADIPCLQVSLHRDGPEDHFRFGNALRPLRDEGILILASGAVTHNFGWLSPDPEAPPRKQAVDFADWMAHQLIEHNEEVALNYRQIAPHGAAAHPTEEHILPLFVAMGTAVPGETPLHRRPEVCYGGLAMDMFVWK